MPTQSKTSGVHKPLTHKPLVPKPLVPKPLARKPLTSKPLINARQKSVGAIIFNAKNEVLIMFSSQNKYWEFPKGKIERGEKELDTLKREVYEETGIQRFRLNPAFRDYLRYTFRVGNKLIRKIVVYYLFKTGSDVNVSDEHTDYKWVKIEQAREFLKHPNQHKLVDRIEEFLSEHPL